MIKILAVIGLIQVLRWAYKAFDYMRFDWVQDAEIRRFLRGDMDDDIDAMYCKHESANCGSTVEIFDEGLVTCPDCGQKVWCKTLERG